MVEVTSLVLTSYRCGRHKVDEPAEAFPPSQRMTGGWCNRAYRERNAGNPTHQRANRNSRFKREYGITHDEYDAMLAKQYGGCAVCGKPEAGKRLAVDHDHRTGKVRGLLCENCNRALGMAQDSPTILRALADYLEY